MCVTGETFILTKKGYFQIQSLKDQEVEIWNGNEWNQVTIKQTAPRRHFITIFFSNGCSLTCTPDHKFIVCKKIKYLNSGYIRTAKRSDCVSASSCGGASTFTKRITAQMLMPGIKLRQESLPIIDGNEVFNHPFIHGALCAFGCFTEDGPILDIMGPSLYDILNHTDMVVLPSGTKVFPDDLPSPYVVPINSSIIIKLQWLIGFLNTRSFINEMGVTLININEKMLQDIQLLFSTLNIYSYIQHSNLNKIPLPDNKSVTVHNYTLIIPFDEFDKLRDLIIKSRKFDVPQDLVLGTKFLSMELPRAVAQSELSITEIIDIGRLSPAYSFIAEKNNTVIFNGILTDK